MIKISEIISKPILNLYSGKIEGVVSNLYFDKKYQKIQYLKIFDNDEEEYLIDSSKIYSIGQNAIVIKNNEAIIFKATVQNLKENNPINLEAFSIQGENFGKLIDIEVDEHFKTKKFFTNTNVFCFDKIININENIIINNLDKKISLDSLKPKLNIKVTKTNNIVTIMPKQDESQDIIKEDNNISLPQIFQEKKPTYKINTQPTPQKITTNNNFLLGRKVLKTIYGLNNEIIIKKDSIITEKSIESAQKHNKLTELTVFSKPKLATK